MILEHSMNQLILNKYERIKEAIDRIKEKDGFQCLKCGSCCHGPPNPVSESDIEYMKEKGVDLEGIEIEGTGHIRSRQLKILEDHLCYYYEKESKTCRIHPHNPLLCYTYPFVVNIGSGTFAFKPCLREQKIRRKYITNDLRKELQELEHLEWEERDRMIALDDK